MCFIPLCNFIRNIFVSENRSEMKQRKVLHENILYELPGEEWVSKHITNEPVCET